MSKTIAEKTFTEEQIRCAVLAVMKDVKCGASAFEATLRLLDMLDVKITIGEIINL